MPNPIEGIDVDALDAVHRHALAILVQATPNDLAGLKNLMHLGAPTVVGMATLETFVGLAATHGLDLTDDGVHAFKTAHRLDDSGANAGAIGPTTASVYCRELVVAVPPPPAAGRHVTPRGLAVVENFEGYSATAYRDVRGILTIGWGHTGPDVHDGLTITRDRAVALLHGDMGTAEHAIERLVRVPLTDNQFDALASLIYNIGDAGFAGSTVLRDLNAGDYQGAADAFLLWNKGEIGGRMVAIAGLTSRRHEERVLFLAA
jgi:lysozyme